MVNDYFIKAGYTPNPHPEMYHDTLEDSVTYQVPVYQKAAEAAQSLAGGSVLDIGCGLGTKLVQLVAPHCREITGVDFPATIEHCRAVHRQGRWLAADFTDASFSLSETFDVIIAADVIEHLLDPDRLLAVIAAHSHERTSVILSTPERDLRRGPKDMGPPGNPAHVREWNQEEFTAYVTSRGFVIRESSIVNLREGKPTCQMVVGSIGRIA